MDKNSITGMLLMCAVIFGFMWLNKPSEAQLAEQRRIQDSIAQVEAQTQKLDATQGDVDTLTTTEVAQLREIMAATCYRDEYTTSGTAKKWGYGKLDIDAGIKYLIAKLHGDVDCDGAVTAADVSCLYDIMLGNSIRHIERADINGDNSINSTDISLLYTILLSQ